MLSPPVFLLLLLAAVGGGNCAAASATHWGTITTTIDWDLHASAAWEFGKEQSPALVDLYNTIHAHFNRARNLADHLLNNGGLQKLPAKVQNELVVRFSQLQQQAAPHAAAHALAAASMIHSGVAAWDSAHRLFAATLYDMSKHVDADQTNNRFVLVSAPTHACIQTMWQLLESNQAISLSNAPSCASPRHAQTLFKFEQSIEYSLLSLEAVHGAAQVLKNQSSEAAVGNLRWSLVKTGAGVVLWSVCAGPISVAIMAGSAVLQGAAAGMDYTAAGLAEAFVQDVEYQIQRLRMIHRAAAAMIQDYLAAQKALLVRFEEQVAQEKAESEATIKKQAAQAEIEIAAFKAQAAKAEASAAKHKERAARFEAEAAERKWQAAVKERECQAQLASCTSEATAAAEERFRLAQEDYHQALRGCYADLRDAKLEHECTQQALQRLQAVKEQPEQCGCWLF